MTFNVAIVGYGTQGVYHTKNINENDAIDMKVTGSYDIDPRADEDAAEIGLTVYPSFNDLIADEAVDAVFICTPNDSHFPYAMEAIAAGKHVLVEKPAMLDSAEMEEATQAAVAAGLALIVHQNRRWDPDFAVIKKVYDEEMIGAPTFLQARIHGSRGIPGDWRRVKASGGGMVLDWGVHSVDRVLMMVNSPVVDVYGQLSFALGCEVDDGFRAHLTFANGFRASFDISTTSYIPEALHWMQAANGTVQVTDWDLNGSLVRRTGAEEDDAAPVQAGVGLTKTMAPRIMDYGYLARTAPPVEEIPLPEVSPDVMEFYYNAVGVMNGTEEPAIKNSDVIRCLKILEAVIESSETHEVVHPETADQVIR